MDRLTHPRNSGIKTGYWSPEKKDTLIERLAAYEDTGLTPKEMVELKDFYENPLNTAVPVLEQVEADRWIPVEERLPEDDNYILISFDNFDIPLVSRYEADQEGGAFYLGDCDGEDTCVSENLFVIAWMPLPESYREES